MTTEQILDTVGKNGDLRKQLERRFMAATGLAMPRHTITLAVIDGQIKVIEDRIYPSPQTRAEPRRRRRNVLDGRSRDAKVGKLLAHVPTLVRPGEEQFAAGFFGALHQPERDQYCRSAGVRPASQKTWDQFIEALAKK